MFDDETLALASQVLDVARVAGVRVRTAESCTGGLVAAALTQIAGSSDVMDRGFVAYSNAAKTALLDVPDVLLAAYGAVSEPVARAMAEGALGGPDAVASVAITGIAGPGGGSADKPVGLVWFAAARTGGETKVLEMRFGDIGRSNVRAAAVKTALELLIQCLPSRP